MNDESVLLDVESVPLEVYEPVLCCNPAAVKGIHCPPAGSSVQGDTVLRHCMLQWVEAGLQPKEAGQQQIEEDQQ